MKGPNGLSGFFENSVQPFCVVDGILEHDLGQVIAELMAYRGSFAEGCGDLDGRICSLCNCSRQGCGIMAISRDQELSVR